MNHVIDGKPATKEIDATCQHKMTAQLIDGTRYRFCKHCGMEAHADGSFAYLCGHPYCRCSS